MFTNFGSPQLNKQKSKISFFLRKLTTFVGVRRDHRRLPHHTGRDDRVGHKITVESSPHYWVLYWIFKLCQVKTTGDLKANFQPGRAPHIIIVTRPPTVPGRDLNEGPLSFEASALLTELTRPVMVYHGEIQ